MRAIILAAGQGTRLESAVPQCFIKVKEKTILERQIDILSQLGITDITVVISDGGVWSTGNQAKVNELHGINTVINKKSMETQSPYSTLLGMGARQAG